MWGTVDIRASVEAKWQWQPRQRYGRPSTYSTKIRPILRTRAKQSKRKLTRQLHPADETIILRLLLYSTHSSMKHQHVFRLHQPSPRISSLTRVLGRSYKHPNPVLFPGEDAPGIGRRHFPRREEAVEDFKFKKVDQHHLLTTEQCYELFPCSVHTSCPLKVLDKGTPNVLLFNLHPV